MGRMPEPNAHPPKPPAGPRYQPLVTVLAAVATGILADRFWPLSVGMWWGAAVVACGLWLVCWRANRDGPAGIALLLAVAATAGGWHHCCWHLFPVDDLGYFARHESEPVCLRGVALQLPRLSPASPPDPLRAIPTGERTQLDLAVTGIRDGRRWMPADGRVRLKVDGRLETIAAGDRLEVFGQLLGPPRVLNPGGFAYADYLRADRLRAQVFSRFPECVSVVQTTRLWSLRRLIDRARHHSSDLLRRYLAPKHWPLATAVLLGQRENLDPEQADAFAETGTAHLLAISGLHLGILAGVLFFLFRRLPISQTWAAVAVAAIMLGYMLLTDARPPVIRATILVLVTCGATCAARPALSMNSLAAAGLVILAISPADLFHTGAQLSFLAVAVIMLAAPRLQGVLRRRTTDPLERLLTRYSSRSTRLARAVAHRTGHLLLISALIWLVITPLVMARFHLITPMTVLWNTVLWIPMAAALVSGFATLVFGMALPLVAMLSSQVCNASLGLLAGTVEAGRDWPLSHYWVPGPADWWLGGFYGGLGLLAAFPRLRPPRRWCVALLSGWIGLGMAHAAWRPGEDRLDCSFLAMGHGCAVLLELPGGKTLLYDAGQFNSPHFGSRSIAELLWSRGITHLDAVILSHPDLDHYNALPDLLDRLSVGAVYTTPMMWQEQSRALTTLRAAIDDHGVPCQAIQAGDLLDGGEDCTIEVLHPAAGGIEGGDNANSVVLSVDYAGRRVLLPGDLQPPGLEELLAQLPIPCDVLLAPHHGSRRSNPPGLAAWCLPKWIVVSGSPPDDRAALDATYAEAGGQTLYTSETGAVFVNIDAEGVRVRTFLDGL